MDFMEFDWWNYFTSGRYWGCMAYNLIPLMGVAVAIFFIRCKDLAAIWQNKMRHFTRAIALTIIIIGLLSYIHPSFWLPLSQQDYTSLTRVSGNCLIQHDAKFAGTYLVKGESRWKYNVDLWLMCLSFDSDALDGKQVTFWHKNHVVYQIAVDGETLYQLYFANTYIAPYNIVLVTTKYSLIFLTVCFFILEGYTKKENDDYGVDFFSRI